MTNIAPGRSANQIAVFTIKLNYWFLLSFSAFSLLSTGGVPVSALASSAINCGFGLWSGQTNDYKICILQILPEHAVLRSEIKNRFGRYLEWCVPEEQHVYHWTVVSVRSHYSKVQLKVLVQYNTDIIIKESNLFSPWYSWNLAHLA